MKVLSLLSYLKALRGSYHHAALALSMWLISRTLTGGFILVIVYGLWLSRYGRKGLLLIIGILVLYEVARVGHQPEPLESVDKMTIVYIEPNRQRFVGKTSTTQVLVYYEADTPSLRAGDHVSLRGTVIGPHPIMIPGEFDYATYLYARNITAVVKADHIEWLESQWSIYRIREWMAARIATFSSTSQTYLSTFILADRSTFDPDFSREVSRLGIAHLFAVSGLHVATLGLCIDKGLGALRVRKGISDAILGVTMGLYMVITLFAASVVRAGLMAVFLMINRRFKLGLTAVDVVALLFCMLLLVRPYYYVESGFILTFAVSASLLLGQPFFKTPSRFLLALRVSTLAFFASLPIVSGFQYGFNPWTPLLNIPFITYTTLILLPMSYLTFLLPWLEPIHYGAVVGFEQLVRLAQNGFPIWIRLWIEPGWFRFLYASLFVIVLAMWHHRLRHLARLIFVLFLGICYMRPWLIVEPGIWFFHVHGDSALIRDRFNRCNILIDTGSANQQERLVSALHALHVSHFDYVFISHMHEDHFGAFDHIAATFPINQVISNQNSEDYAEQWFFCGDVGIYLHALEFPHVGENDRSLVMHIQIGQDTVLFTGDVEALREQTILKHPLKAHILKVPHHGSNTSSSADFLRTVQPELAINSAHRNTRFDHPHDDVVARYEDFDIPLYRTDMHGTIEIRYRQGTRIIRPTLSP